MPSKQTLEAMKRAGLTDDEAEKLADRFTLAEARRATVKRLMSAGFTGNEAEAIYAKLRRRPKKGKSMILRKKKAVKEVDYEDVVVHTKEETADQKKYRKVIEGRLTETKALLSAAVVDELIAGSIKRDLKPKQVERAVDASAEEFAGHLIDATEACGIVGAQSIGEPGTQMSLPYEERVVVREAGRVRVAPIGQIIDEHMDAHPVSQDADTEWCDLPAGTDLSVPSLDQAGRVVWKPVQSLSRHRHARPLLRLRLRSGRTVTATENHSFVTRRDGTIIPVVGRELSSGDHVPVVKRLDVPEASGHLALRDFFPPEAVWYGSELAKARSMMPDWRSGFGSEFVVPVGREQLSNHLAGSSTFAVEDGFAYPFQNHSRARLPERMPLDGSFGWLVGAYLAEGSAFRYHVNIANTDPAFLARTRDVGRRLGIGTSEYGNQRGFGVGHDLRLQSSLLTRLLAESCGRGSAAKRVPDFAFGADDGFVGALLRAYFDGDGNVTVSRNAIRASSRSKELIDGIALLLARFGIFSSLGTTGSSHTLWIPGRYAKAFRDRIGFESESNRAALDGLCARPAGRHTYDALDVVCGFGGILVEVARKLRLATRTVASATKRQRIGRATLARTIERFERRAEELGVDVAEELARLRRYVDEDVIWDEIVAVERLPKSEQTVYDFSVPGLETFTTGQGVVTHNTMRTFHYAGVAEINVTLGLPRLIEIVDARRSPSTPMMNIYLKPAWARDPEKVQRAANEIETTRLKDIAAFDTDLGDMSIMVKPDPKQLDRKNVSIEEIEDALKKLKKTAQQRKGDNIHLTLDEPSYKRLQQLSEQIHGLKVKGIDGIERVVIRKEPGEEEYVVYAEGSNLAEVLKVEGVDQTRVTTNDVQGIFEVLGVEAARNAIVTEAYNTLSEQGLQVDVRHLMLVADVMTVGGTVRAIGRQGVSGEKTSILARAAFEITVDHLLRAGLRGEADTLRGVAENIIVGQPVNLGTGAVRLMVDVEKMANVKPPKENVVEPPPPVAERGLEVPSLIEAANQIASEGRIVPATPEGDGEEEPAAAHEKETEA